MKRLIAVLISTILLLGISGCGAKRGAVKLEKMEQNDIAKVVKKGTTTKSDITAKFGQPGATSILQDGKEVWTYSFIKMSVKGQAMIPFYSMFVSKTTDNVQKTLRVFFKGDIVDNYSFSASNDAND